MILFRYMARRYLLAFLGVAAVLAGILFLIDLVEQFRRYARQPLTFSEAMWLAGLRTPASLYAVLPLVAILATLAMFVGLARSSELVVVRAVGRSALWVVTAPALVAFLIGAVAVAVVNPFVAATTRQHDVMASRLGGGEAALLSVSREGLWLREGIDGAQRVIHAQRASGDGRRLFDVSVLAFDADHAPVARIEAAAASLGTGVWELENAKLWRLDADNPERAAVTEPRVTLPTELTEAGLLESFGAPVTIPIWDLPAFIARLDRAGFAALEHRVWFHSELALPLLLAAMVLVGASFTLGHIRSGRQGILVLAALVAGFFVFFLRDFTQVLGENAQIPVLLAAWSPPVIAALLPLAAMLQLEEG